jgi:hypothetical protein
MWRRLVRILVPLGAAMLLTVLALNVGRLVLAPTRDASIDAVRIRNAMVAELGEPDQTNWTPSAVPANYHWEALPPPSYFVTIANQIVPPDAQQESALAKAIRIARHLRETARHGSPIQANTRETYERIIHGQGGYCSDFTQAFNALVLAAGLQVREWGFTWEDMANGHAFSEVWDPALGKWVLIDSFISFYVVNAATGVPMGALEFRASLLGEPGSGQAKIVPIVADHFGFKTHEKALDWYRRGVPRMFLLLGNEVFSYDANPLISLTEPLPRSVEMVIAIMLGKHPRFLFVPPASHPEVKDQVSELQGQLVSLLIKLLAIAVLGVSLVVFAWRSLRARRQLARSS